MNFFSNIATRSSNTSNSILLLFVIFTIFITPFFPIAWHLILYSISITIVFLLSAIALNDYQPKIFYATVLVILIEWLAETLSLSLLTQISFLVNILFFDLIVLLFILQIAKAKTVTFRVIMESVTGYLMLGLSFSILIGLVCFIDPTSFSFEHLTGEMNPSYSYFSNYTYYAFVTLTTLGYGDVVPLSPAARSLSIFTSITGQMYVAIIIAALVSKYLGQRSKDD
jgi:voltage-gated potassium channel